MSSMSDSVRYDLEMANDEVKSHRRQWSGHWRRQVLT